MPTEPTDPTDPVDRPTDPNDPIAEFRRLFERARSKEPFDATAAALATADAAGRPAARMVLLKGVDERGFVFYTNYGSRKARELEANPRAALCCHWPASKVQARVEGRVERISEEESDAYFAGRPRGSQVAAWASRQSEPLESRTRLMSDYLKLQAKFGTGEVPRPDFWGGYRIEPDRIEFWHNQLHRLHDRIAWIRESDGWRKERLYP